MSSRQPIVLKNVRVHNLKEVNLTLNPDELIVFTGVSGSGKSSLAFDTIYVEGQRRYIESLSTHARRQLGDLTKPDADAISGISPTIAIEQKSVGKNPRSTVGTLTGIADFLRVLFAKVAVPYCPISGEALLPQSEQEIIQHILKFPTQKKMILLAPLLKGKKGTLKDEFADLLRKGFMRVRLDGKIVDLSEEIDINETSAHDLDLVIDRFVIEQENFSRISQAVLQALEIGKGVLLLLDVATNEEHLFSKFAYSRKSHLSYPPLEPHDFSFNHPLGMCKECQGLGSCLEFDLNLVIDPEKSISEDCCSIAGSYSTVKWGNIYDNLARLYDFDVTTPWKKLPSKAQDIFLYGVKEKWIRMKFVHPIKKTTWTDYVSWKGILFEAKKRFQEATSDFYREHVSKLMKETRCLGCHGSRLNPYPAAAKLSSKTFQQLCQYSIQECLQFFSSLSFSSDKALIAQDLVQEITKRLHFLSEVGLDYLSLERTAPTLSGGEAQRVRLASHIGSGLVGATYVLDEPSIGLHPRDNLRLIRTLQALKELGNTVIVVEHDEEMILSADRVVDIGPFAGSRGGELLVNGSVQDLLKNERSITGAYLSGRLQIETPKKRRSASKKSLKILKAAHHNLKDINVTIPLERFVCITGLSGSGKSSLISDILYPALSNLLHRGEHSVGKHAGLEGHEHINKVIGIDQSPIGRTPRSNPSTYIKVFDDIRDLFSKLKESQAFGYTPGHFSFNVHEGSCAECKGMGHLKVDMDFMEDAWVLCPTCKGQRFDTSILSIKLKEKNIYDVLAMTVEEALEFFSAYPSIHHALDVLAQVGLGYMTLGQSSTTLSGGEAQRIKLAKELIRPSTGKTLYILDEPTTGLHLHDIKQLISILQKLVDQGNSVVVIEHQMDFVKVADWVIDMGPEGGDLGGYIVAEGTPEKLCKAKTPTSEALEAALYKNYAATSLQKPSLSKIKPASCIDIKGAYQNNLKNLSLSIPHYQITVCTGPSGSGKSSLAFETLYAEGQRRYVESLSAYARQFVKQMPKAKVERIDGLAPAIAIEQKHHAGNPRSTVGTMTEIYDYLRILYARAGVGYCPETLEEIKTITKEFVVSRLLQNKEGSKLIILAPLDLSKQISFEETKDKLQREGFLRIRLNGTFYELDDPIPFDPRLKNTLYLVIDRVIVREGIENRLSQAIDKASEIGKRLFVVSIDDKDKLFNLSFAVESTGKSYPSISAQTFSFNAEEGMCPDCLGLGFQWGANLQEYPEINKLSPSDILSELLKERLSRFSYRLLMKTLTQEGIDPDLSLCDQPPELLSIFLHGSQTSFVLEDSLSLRWQGIYTTLAHAAKAGASFMKKNLLTLMKESCCSSCLGSRLNPLASHVKLCGKTLPDLCSLPIVDALSFIKDLSLNAEQHELLQETHAQLLMRLHFLNNIGLDYLSLNRSAPTLSGGETQRIYLARQLSSGLSGTLYVLDEPTIGLHPYNNTLLNSSLKHLRDLGNTLVLVEHDPMTLQIADHIIDFGPLAGKQGGYITAQGTLEEIKNNPDSLTGLYLSGSHKIAVPKKRRGSTRFLEIKNVTLHNLKNLSVKIPVGSLVCISGVSGSGKSSLLHQVIKKTIQEYLFSKVCSSFQTMGMEHFNKLLYMDQNPIGQTSRSDVSTYVDLLTPLRSFYAKIPEAAAYGLQPANFSYNHKKGMCKSCQGLGYKMVELQFLPPVEIECEDCKGLRLNPLSLKVRYKDNSLGDLLKMSVSEVKDLLPPARKIQTILSVLQSVGLDYLELGQEITSLSGGEAQRLRLSKELIKRSTGGTLYLLDEPTIGLHYEDIKKLVSIFQQLVSQGNTVVIIEHNLDLLAQADYIIDMGPLGGKHGGEIIAQGTPEELMKQPQSLTGKYLKQHLS